MGDMQVYPERYLQLELTAEERTFTRTLQRNFTEESMAYYVLHINPRKKSANGVPELFSLLEKSRYLTDPQGRLKHAMNVCFVLPNIDSSLLEGTLSDQAQAFCREHVLF